MLKSKRVGKVIYDYLVLEKLVTNKRSQYRVECTKCGNEKLTYNLNEATMSHTENSCKNAYAKSFENNEYGDFKVIKSYYDRRLLLDLKCSICGEIRVGIPERDMEKVSNTHGIYCVKNNSKYDKNLINKICRTYSNCKTRIRKGNEGDPKYELYKGKEFGFDSSLEMFYELYDNLLEQSEKYPLDKLTIDRIDTNLGYIKGNVRFITMKEQNCNKNNSYIYYVGENTYESSIDLADYLGTYQQAISRLFEESDEIVYNNLTITRQKRYNV